MKTANRVSLLVGLLLIVSAVFAQQTKTYEPNTYYYNQARQSMDNYDYATAYDKNQKN